MLRVRQMYRWFAFTWCCHGTRLHDRNCAVRRSAMLHFGRRSTWRFAAGNSSHVHGEPVCRNHIGILTGLRLVYWSPLPGMEYPCPYRCKNVEMKNVTKRKTGTKIKPGIQRVHDFADISRSRYVVIATKPVHRLQIRPTVHNYGTLPTIPQSYIPVRAVVWACDDGQTDTQTRVANTHFASSTIHAKCKMSLNKNVTSITLNSHGLRITCLVQDNCNYETEFCSLYS